MPLTVTLPIVGAHFRPPAKALLASLRAGQALWLRPEPDNPYDSNAVQVLLHIADIPSECYDEIEVQCTGVGFDLDAILSEATWHLGFIPKEQAPTFQQKIIASGSDWPGSLIFDGKGKPQIQFDWS